MASVTRMVPTKKSQPSAPGHFSQTDYRRGIARLLRAVEEMTQARTIGELQRIVRVTARAITHCDGATFVLRDADNCVYADEDAIAPLWKGQRFPMDSCVSGWVMTHQQPVTIPDISRDGRVPQDAYRPTFVRSMAMVPIRGSEHAIGAIGNYWAQPRHPSEHEVSLLRALADMTSLAMQNVWFQSVLEKQAHDHKAAPVGKGPMLHRPAPVSIHDTFEAAFTNAPVGIAVVGLDGSFRRANRTFCTITGYREDDLVTLTFQDITHPDDLDADVAQASRLLAGEIASYQMDKRYYSKNGHVVWIRLSVFLVHDTVGQPVNFVAHIEDISERRRDEELLKRQATRDALTGIFNRSQFEEELNRHIALAQNNPRADNTAVFMIDLDGLKQINDQHGHAAGDLYLKTVVDIISRQLRLSDVFARIGGDELAVLLPRTTHGQAHKLAQTLVDHVEAHSRGSICIGIAMVNRDTLDGVLERADQAMYRAKRMGGNTAQSFGVHLASHESQFPV
ncbi:PAS domain S-box/diguanylate cyclase (GGDEF) domain-containing protein (plasmid) [Mycolicibacterium chubuense NBB4]|uniref:PAS domain S-box/diguanylate cyclase (GGDEF) domain-containing protein n=2 Tax=Mycolicibacterium chubuense TaxID=1800 RepID=I4BSK1_MYCCN|nr:PAS domain S-box/diguanylate cyclase (GGDEF) domain-containing protein [Mycolicibacterium chubuense NBB4]